MLSNKTETNVKYTIFLIFKSKVKLKKIIKILQPSYQKVCGSDGSTYQSLCQLEQSSCRFQREVTVLHDGACVAGRMVVWGWLVRKAYVGLMGGR